MEQTNARIISILKAACDAKVAVTLYMSPKFVEYMNACSIDNTFTFHIGDTAYHIAYRIEVGDFDKFGYGIAVTVFPKDGD